MRYEFSVNPEQASMIKRCITAIENYREALTASFLKGNISFSTKTSCSLFFTLNTFKSFLEGYCWEMDLRQLENECKALDEHLANNPYEFYDVQKELEELNNVFSFVSNTATSFISIEG